MPSDDPARNPFRYGALALDEAFADRVDELASLRADALSGQDVVVVAPRRYGKSSVVWRLSRELIAERVLVAHVDLMTVTSPASFAEKLARTVHDDIASRLFKARERLRVFQGLRVAPTVTVDPQTGSLNFGFSAAAAAPVDIHATIERLLELPGELAGERRRQVVLVLDEFQEVMEIDPDLPRLMRAVFQQQPEVSHVYLGSRRHMLERIFSDRNEPFWRSARRMELGPIPPEPFAAFIARRFAGTGRAIDADAVDRVLATTDGHPYATQELCYFTWLRVEPGATATSSTVQSALADVLRSEDSHFTVLWERASAQQRRVLAALAAEPGHPQAADFRRRHALPAASTVQRALETLERAELVGRAQGRAWIQEPFLAAWLRRELAS